MTLNDAANDFLAQHRIAVAGVSRNSRETANFIFRKLRDSGHEMYAINPRATEVEGGPCYPDVASLPVKVDALLLVTPPSAAKALVDQCAENGVRRVWMHRAFGAGSVSREAVEACRHHGIQVIDGACPVMYLKPVDFGHKCMHWIARLTGQLPKVK